MGNCHSLNCTALASDELLDADGDIVGLGVLAAFFVTALATTLAIFWGYFYDALPETYLSKPDQQIIKKYKKSWISTKCLPWLQRKWEYLISKLFSKEQAAVTHKALPRENRTEALTKFILSLSDQQLVTGLAILIGALSNRCKVSIYEFRVVVSLAWFSSTTHLATLGVLQKYFVENQVVRNFRVVGMLSLMVLLLFSLVVQTSLAPQTVSLQCGLWNFSGSAANSNFSASANFSSNSTFSNSTSPDLEASDSLSYSLSLVTLIFLIAAVLSSYYSRVAALYNETTHVVSTFKTLCQSIACCRLKRQYPGFSTAVGAEDFKASWQHLERESVDEQYKKYTMAIKRMKTDLGFGSTLGKYFFILCLAILDYTGSFMSEIPQLGFDMAFGISQVIFSRNSHAPLLGPSSYSMDFGQIVPLFLLALPMLVAAEIYYESRGVLSSKTLSKFSSETSSGSQAGANTVSTPLVVDHSPPDPEGANQQTTNMIYIFIFQLIMSLACGCLYNIHGVPSIVGAILSLISMVMSGVNSMGNNFQISSQIDVLHTQILAHRAKGLGNGARLVSNSHSTVSNSSNGAMSSPANANVDVPSSTGQDPASISHHSNEPESIPLQILTPAPASTTSAPISRAAPERSTSMTATPFTPSTSVSTTPTPSTSAQPEIIEQHNTSPTPRSLINTYYNISSSILSTLPTPRPASQSPNASTISPLDDGRLYRDPPHRHDTEADIGVVPITSLSSRSNNKSTSGEMCPEPEDIQHGVASGVDSGDANISGEEGVRRRGTAELPSSSSLPDGRSREY